MFLISVEYLKQKNPVKLDRILYIYYVVFLYYIQNPVLPFKVKVKKEVVCKRKISHCSIFGIMI